KAFERRSPIMGVLGIGPIRLMTLDIFLGNVREFNDGAPFPLAFCGTAREKWVLTLMKCAVGLSGLLPGVADRDIGVNPQTHLMALSLKLKAKTPFSSLRFRFLEIQVAAVAQGFTDGEGF
ncbi:MAG: hypothetical protein VX597_02200, partial [Pseudomonadota bacterium]|nr:hypothetical protein [Pseudomonadota bacterium]